MSSDRKHHSLERKQVDCFVAGFGVFGRENKQADDIIEKEIKGTSEE